MKEDAKGLLASGRLWLDDSDAATVFEEVKENLPCMGMSFAFIPTIVNVENGIRQLKEVTVLDDVTLTPRPVNRQTAVLEVKSADGQRVPSIRATEAILRDAGFSRKEAKAFLAGGYPSLIGGGVEKPSRDAKDADAATALSLGRILEALSEINGRK
jgi:hypothetical protein